MNQTFNGTLTFWVIWWINNLNFIHQTELGEYLQKFNLKFRKEAKYNRSSLSTTATLGTEESGPCKEAAIVQRFKTRVNVWSFCPLGRKKVAVGQKWKALPALFLYLVVSKYWWHTGSLRCCKVEQIRLVQRSGCPPYLLLELRGSFPVYALV